MASVQSKCSVWQSPPAKPVLVRDAVHIWRATIEVSDMSVGRSHKLLSFDERARANRFRFDADRRHFVVGRGLLRAILSSYLECPPHDLHFNYSQHGKPFLGGAHADSDLNFNLAHSGALALYAITLGRAIGVDVERLRPDCEMEKIAQEFFSAGETSQLLSIPAEARAEAFFDAWTRKEAFIKAKGIGLSLPLDQFEVSLSRGEPVFLLETKWDANERSQWSLSAIDVGPGYAAAVAVEGDNRQTNYWKVPDDMLNLERAPCR